MFESRSPYKIVSLKLGLCLLVGKFCYNHAGKWNFRSGDNNTERATALYSCHGVFTDQASFRPNFRRIQIPEGALQTITSFATDLSALHYA